MRRFLLILSSVVVSAYSLPAQVVTDKDAAAGFRFVRKDSTLNTAVTQRYSAGDIDFSPSNDIRAGFATMPGVSITENGAPGRQISATFMNGPSAMIDGMIVDLGMEHLSIDEIESVTVLGGVVDRLKNGMGNGFCIRTALGKTPGFQIKARIENSFVFSGRKGKWCDGVSYAGLMNRAREASGLPVLYTDEQISLFSKGNAYDLENPCLDMYGLTIRDWRSAQKASLTMSGMQGKTAFFGNINYIREGDNYKIGPAADYHSINARANLCTNFTQDLSLDVRTAFSLDIRRTPNSGFNIAASGTPPVEFPLVVGKSEEDGTTIWGVSRLVPDNYYAALMECGSRTGRNRFGSIKASLNYDFAKFAPGLRSETQIGLLMYGATVDGSKGDYLASYLDNTSGSWIPSTTHQGEKSSAKSVLSTSYTQNLYLKETLKYSLSRGWHKLDASAWAKMTASQTPGARTRTAVISADANYSFRNRYIAQVVLYSPGSSQYEKSKMFAFGGAGGLAWIITNEEWMKQAKGIDHLKVMAQAGWVPLDVVSSQYLFHDSYVKKGSFVSGVSDVGYSWISNQGNSVTKSGTAISRLGNKSLGRGGQLEFNAGLEGSFLNGRLNVSSDFVWIHNTGLLTDASPMYPKFYGMNGVTTYINWNRTITKMFDAGISWKETRSGVTYELSYWGRMSGNLRDRYLETVINDYNKVEGTYESCIRGYTCLGKFASQEEINSAPRQTFDTKTQVGDLRYADLDNNGVIDSNDISVIVRNASGMQHNFRFSLRAGKFDVMMLFRARTGSVVNLLSCGYYSGGRGYTNYSVWIKDNVGGAYPRLAYEGNSGNFQTSQFWLRNADFLKLRNLELGYNFPSKGIRIFLRGENLFSIDAIKDLDPEYLTAGYSTYAINRTVSIGFSWGIK